MDLEAAKSSLVSSKPADVVGGIEAIGKAGGLTDLPSLMPFVKHGNPRVKNAAVLASSTIIRTNLLTRFSELVPAVRAKLAVILQTLSPSIVDELGKDLFSENDEHRLIAVQILGLLKGNPRVRDILAQLVQDRNEKVRATAVHLLGRIVAYDDRDAILQLLSDKDKRVRANTVEALESLGDKRIVPVLLRFRKDPNNRIRGNVLKALYSLGYRDIEGDLLMMTGNSDHFMKASAFWVVSATRLAGRKIEDAAGFYLLSENRMVAENARKALAAIDSLRAKGYLRYLGGGEETGDRRQEGGKRAD